MTGRCRASFGAVLLVLSSCVDSEQGVQISNLPSFPFVDPDNSNVRATANFSRDELVRMRSGDEYRIAWDLNLAVPHRCHEEDYCPRQVFTRFTFSPGGNTVLESPTIPLNLVMDTKAPHVI